MRLNADSLVTEGDRGRCWGLEKSKFQAGMYSAIRDGPKTQPTFK